MLIRAPEIAFTILTKYNCDILNRKSNFFFFFCGYGGVRGFRKVEFFRFYGTNPADRVHGNNFKTSKSYRGKYISAHVLSIRHAVFTGLKIVSGLSVFPDSSGFSIIYPEGCLLNHPAGVYLSYFHSATSEHSSRPPNPAPQPFVLV